MKNEWMQQLRHKFIFIGQSVTDIFNEIIIKLHIAHDKISFRNFFHKILFKFFTTHTTYNRNMDG